ncbi:hypothetical protein [Cryobacterium roopkundense]|uniref:Uncharacterized protein n=1 Tax=Cryobacterium roopkundense TaxID=1001240 RepID=A0A7W8ZVF0_9MICO|nr:hypothetical protein [Cryobacterium roopkundense]MBB5640968.1 hypothetical protein [Cryobacterium roopkundense]
MFDQHPKPPDSRWISVIFLQGEHAEDVLGMIDRSGPAMARQFLRQWDYGDETTEAALTNGYVYDHIPAGKTDRTFEDATSPYALTYSTQFRYVSLLRRYPVAPEWEPAPAPSTMPAIRTHHAADIWAPPGDRASSTAGHAVAL